MGAVLITARASVFNCASASVRKRVAELSITVRRENRIDDLLPWNVAGQLVNIAAQIAA
jgi:hypothetical protein